ncbi:MAG TPA: hypothetical protein VNT99_08420 [Methylomirabilota bacterium]|nr:hypothetical protein [Methylomirabilota bacterium]
MSTVIACPHCGKDFEVDDAGKYACWHCGGHVSFAGEDYPPVMSTPAAARKDHRSRGFGWWTLTRVAAWVFFLGPAFLLIFLTMLGIGVGKWTSSKRDSTSGSVIVTVGMITFIPIAIGWLLNRLGLAHSKELVCSQCGNNTGLHAKICATCRAPFAMNTC